MKRVFTIVLAFAFLCVGAVTVFAEGETVEISQSSQSGSTEVTLTAEFPDPTYVMTIPAKIDFGKKEISKTSSKISQTFTIKFSQMSFFDEKNLHVSAYGSGTGGAFTLAGETSGLVVPYAFICVSDEVSPNEDFTLLKEEDGDTSLACSLSVDMGGITKEDVYAGQMFFQAELK